MLGAIDSHFTMERFPVRRAFTAANRTVFCDTRTHTHSDKDRLFVSLRRWKTVSLRHRRNVFPALSVWLFRTRFRSNFCTNSCGLMRAGVCVCMFVCTNVTLGCSLKAGIAFGQPEKGHKFSFAEAETEANSSPPSASGSRQLR